MHDVHSQHINKQQYNYIYICVCVSCRKGFGFILFPKHLSPRCGFVEAKTWIFDCEQTYLPSFSKKTRIWPSDLLEKTLSHLWLQSISTYIIIYIYISLSLHIYIYIHKFMSSIRFWAVTCCFVLGEQESSWREVPVKTAGLVTGCWLRWSATGPRKRGKLDVGGLWWIGIGFRIGFGIVIDIPKNIDIERKSTINHRHTKTIMKNPDRQKYIDIQKP